MRTITMRQPQQFLDRASRGQPTAVRTTNPALAHILTVQNELSHAATLLQDKLGGAPDQDASFPTTPIGRQLQVVAKLLTSRTPVAVLKVSHGSFDTHSNQRTAHDRLLHELAAALVAFRQAMRTANLWQQVVLMTYAELAGGRRKTAAPAPTMARLHRTSSWAARYAADCTASSRL